MLIEEPFWILALDSICGGITSAIDGLRVAQEEAMLLTTNIQEGISKPSHLVQIRETPLEMAELSESAPLVSPTEERAAINFERSRTHHHGTRPSYGDMNVFSRLKSVS